MHDVAMIADGGAIADTGLIVNMLIAVGTIGAAAVALGLGLSAHRATQRTYNEARREITRQLLFVYEPGDPRIGPYIQVINASPEAVTHLFVQMSTSSSWAETNKSSTWLVWKWEDDDTPFVWPPPNYLLPGQSTILKGGFWEALDDTAAPTERRSSVRVEAIDANVILTWQDSYGEIWARRNNAEPYPSDFVKPGRDARDFVEPRRWPGHWPEKNRFGQ